jgi:hypothetical protein
MPWPPGDFNMCGMSGGPATIWNNIPHFDDGWQFSCYWIQTNASGCIANLGMAMNLVIDKCNAMQAQIDELSMGGEVSMGKILSAMLVAEFDEFRDFIGIIDGYRVALWDQWFNVEYYAALARGFRDVQP